MHGGGCVHKGAASSVFDDSEEGEDECEVLASANSEIQKPAPKNVMSFDLALKQLDVQKGLKEMAKLKGAKSAAQGGRKLSPVKTKTEIKNENLKKVFDSSCDSEQDLTPMKKWEGAGAKRGFSSAQSPQSVEKRLKGPMKVESPSLPDSREDADEESDLINRLLDGTAKDVETVAAKTGNAQSKKKLIDFAVRFGDEQLKKSEKLSFGTLFAGADSEQKTKSGPAAKCGAKPQSTKSKPSPLPSREKKGKQPIPPPVDIQSLVGSKVFELESMEEKGSWAKEIIQKAKQKARRNVVGQKETQRRQARTIAKMVKCSQDVCTSDTEEPNSQRQKGGGKTTAKGSKVSVRNPPKVDKSQQQIDSFLTSRPSRNKVVDLDELLKIPEELPVLQVDLAEELRQEERMRQLEANLERSVFLMSSFV